MSESEKRGLRGAARERRRLAAGEATGAAEALADIALRELRLAESDIVAGYAALGDEIDVFPVLARLAARGLATALPVIHEPAAPLRFRAWRPGDPLVRARHGTREPPEGAAELRPSVLLVPLLAFDAEGFRLGYGGGYYDRTLAALAGPERPVTLGAAYACQFVTRLPREAHDQPLDGVLTEQGITWFYHIRTER